MLFKSQFKKVKNEAIWYIIINNGDQMALFLVELQCKIKSELYFYYFFSRLDTTLTITKPCSVIKKIAVLLAHVLD